MDKSQVKVRILFFAKARELSGVDHTTLVISNEIRGKDLLDFLCQNYNLDIVKETLILAINEEYCEDLNTILVLKNNSEIAVIPPISGG